MLPSASAAMASMAGARANPYGVAEGFTGFGTWSEVLSFVREGGQVYYWAPLDHRPVQVRAEIRKRKKIRIFPPTRDADAFTADAGHLNRFRAKLSEIGPLYDLPVDVVVHDESGVRMFHGVGHAKTQEEARAFVAGLPVRIRHVYAERGHWNVEVRASYPDIDVIGSRLTRENPVETGTVALVAVGLVAVAGLAYALWPKKDSVAAPGKPFETTPPSPPAIPPVAVTLTPLDVGRTVRVGIGQTVALDLPIPIPPPTTSPWTVVIAGTSIVESQSPGGIITIAPLTNPGLPPLPTAIGLERRLYVARAVGTSTLALSDAASSVSGKIAIEVVGAAPPPQGSGGGGGGGGSSGGGSGGSTSFNPGPGGGTTQMAYRPPLETA